MKNTRGAMATVVENGIAPEEEDWIAAAIKKSLDSAAEEEWFNTMIAATALPGHESCCQACMKAATQMPIADDTTQIPIADDTSDDDANLKLAIQLSLMSVETKARLCENEVLCPVPGDGNCAIYTILFVWYIALNREYGSSAMEMFIEFIRPAGYRYNNYSRADVVDYVREKLAEFWQNSPTIAGVCQKSLLGEDEVMERIRTARTVSAYLDDVHVAALLSFFDIFVYRDMNGTRTLVGNEMTGIFVPGVIIRYNGVNHYELIVEKRHAVAINELNALLKVTKNI
jgi:hypothetical protein